MSLLKNLYVCVCVCDVLRLSAIRMTYHHVYVCVCVKQINNVLIRRLEKMICHKCWCDL